jgi:HEAT repeat protein
MDERRMKHRRLSAASAVLDLRMRTRNWRGPRCVRQVVCGSLPLCGARAWTPNEVNAHASPPGSPSPKRCCAPHSTTLARPPQPSRFCHGAWKGFGRIPGVLLLSLLCLATGLRPSLAATVDATGLDRAFAQLNTYAWGQPAEALSILDEAIAATHHDPAARRQLERRLAAVVGTNAPVAAKQVACRKLALIGSGATVPALAALLPHSELSHMARFALERIPDPAAASALRAALPQAHGQLKVGIINSLGLRADPLAGPALAMLLRDLDLAVVGAAVMALGRIGTPQAAQALEALAPTAPTALEPTLNDALMMAAEGLVRLGERAEAARLCRSLYERKTGTLRLAGFRGLVQVEPDRAVSLLSQALAGNDEPLRRLAASLITDLSGPSALQPFLDAYARLPAAGQAALLDAARSRRDSIARPTVLTAASSADPAVRLAALRALAVIGTGRDVAMLAVVATSAANDDREAARAALAALPGREPTEAILAMLPGATVPLRVELIRALSARGASHAAPSLAPLVNDPEAAVRLAALQALAALGDAAEVPAAITSLRQAPDEPTRDQARRTLGALVSRAGTNSVEALASGLLEAPPAVGVFLLEQLGVAGGNRALATVRGALGGSDAALRASAFRVLAGWPDWAAAPDLLESARQADQPDLRALAFRGYVRLCREAPMSATERLVHLDAAARLAADPARKMLVAAALADVPHPGALKLLDGFLGDPEVVEAAGLAAVKVALGLDARHKDEVVPALQRVVKLCKNTDLQRQARAALLKFGASAE